MSSWTSYPKIYTLGHAAVTEILDGPVLVEEKVDGSQFSFGVINGALCIRSKGADINNDAPPTMFGRAVTTVRVLHERGLLVPGYTYRGEVLDSPRHNVLAYDRAPEGNVILFDITTGLETYMPRAEKEAEAKALGLEIVPVLFEGMVTTIEQFKALLETTSILGGQKIEGVVVKQYTRFGPDGKPLLAKFVSEAYKEVHKGAWREQNPLQNDILQQCIVAYRTPARFAKAVQHLRDDGKLEGTPKDIGLLIREVPDDVKAELEIEIKERLWQWAWPHIRRGVTAGLPEWYKEQLLNKQFGITDVNV
jgi:RNA ligase